VCLAFLCASAVPLPSIAYRTGGLFACCSPPLFAMNKMIKKFLDRCDSPRIRLHDLIIQAPVAAAELNLWIASGGLAVAYSFETIGKTAVLSIFGTLFCCELSSV
jgi:hypothetical protein